MSDSLNKTLPDSETGNRRTVFITGSPYCSTAEFAWELNARHGICAAVAGDAAAAKKLISETDRSGGLLIFIHLTMPVSMLAERITEYYMIPPEDAMKLAVEAEAVEKAEDFDETVGEDVIVLTYTGESKTSPDRFVDICACVINGLEEEDISSLSEDS